MLARTAANIFWMGRSLERAANLTRVIQAAMQMSLAEDESRVEHWRSVLDSNGLLEGFSAEYDHYTNQNVLDYLLRNRNNPSRLLRLLEAARHNARIERSRLSRQTFEAINNAWRRVEARLARPVSQSTALDLLISVRDDMAFISGTVDATMLRSDFFDFFSLGTYIERADNSARILDVKYYMLLPSVSMVGSGLDNAQWEAILHTFSALRAYNWVYRSELSATNIANFIILDVRMPRSFLFCYREMLRVLKSLEQSHGIESAATAFCQARCDSMQGDHIDRIFTSGLHEYIRDFIGQNNQLGVHIAKDYHLL